MANAKKKERTATQESLALQPNRWDKMVEAWQKRPGFYVTLLFVGAVVVVGAIYAVNYFVSSSAEEENRLWADLQAALDVRVKGEIQADEKVALLLAAEDRMRGNPQEPWFLVETARALVRQAEWKRSALDKIELYEDALERARRVREEFPDNLLATLPWRPSTLLTGAPSSTLVDRIITTCEHRIASLQKHPVDIRPEPDPDLSALIELEDPDGNAHKMKLRFFSNEAPYCVHNFIRLAKRGFWNGTLVFGQERDVRERPEEVHGITMGSAMTKVAPDRPELWMAPKDDIGYTLPMEQTLNALRRGSIAMARQWEGGVQVGANPAWIMLATQDEYITDGQGRLRYNAKNRPVFAELDLDDEDTRRTLDALEAEPVRLGEQNLLAIDQARVFPLEHPWKITRVTITGQPAHQEPTRLRHVFKMPSAPPPRETDTEQRDREPPGDQKKNDQPPAAPGKDTQAPGSDVKPPAKKPAPSKKPDAPGSKAGQKKSASPPGKKPAPPAPRPDR